jgi:CRP/FNR family transcriptional regulator, cyclic AMP receptor protein
MNALIAYIASLLVIGTFGMRTMMPLRIVALASNISLIIYAALGHLYPVLVLQLILLPLNSWRLLEIIRLVRRLRGAVTEDSVYKALMPFAHTVTIAAGQEIMRKGDPSDALYLVMEGSLWVVEATTEIGPGGIVGEIGVLSSSHLRTATVVAKTECRLGRVSAADFERVYYTDPSVGLSLARLIIDRLTRDIGSRQVLEIEAGA